METAQRLPERLFIKELGSWENPHATLSSLSLPMNWSKTGWIKDNYLLLPFYTVLTCQKKKKKKVAIKPRWDFQGSFQGLFIPSHQRHWLSKQNPLTKCYSNSRDWVHLITKPRLQEMQLIKPLQLPIFYLSLLLNTFSYWAGERFPYFHIFI